MNPLSSSELVLQARKKLSKSQKVFATMLGKDQSLVSRYERGRAMPPGDVVMHCMHILNDKSPSRQEVPLDDLVQAIKSKLADPGHAQARALLLDLLNVLTRPS